MLKIETNQDGDADSYPIPQSNQKSTDPVSAFRSNSRRVGAILSNRRASLSSKASNAKKVKGLESGVSTPFHSESQFNRQIPQAKSQINLMIQGSNQSSEAVTPTASKPILPLKANYADLDKKEDEGEQTFGKLRESQKGSTKGSGKSKKKDA